MITATALYVSMGNIHLFGSGRHLASRLGITPKEHSSGGRRRLGRISKQGDPLLCTLLIHGARSALNMAESRKKAGQPLTALQAWAVGKVGTLRHSNQAAVGLAKKLARIAWEVWRHKRPFDGNHALRLAGAEAAAESRQKESDRPHPGKKRLTLRSVSDKRHREDGGAVGPPPGQSRQQPRSFKRTSSRLAPGARIIHHDPDAHALHNRGRIYDCVRTPPSSLR